MTVRYQDGTAIEAIILSQTDSSIRAVVKGSPDTLGFTKLFGTWLTDSGDPVQIEFAWQRKTRQQIVTESDCVCSHELAAHLIHLLWNGEQDEVKPGMPLHDTSSADDALKLN